MPTDLRTRAIVLRRTNYGESDRILNFLTPEGKVSALAHGVRKEKSRLAGGIELFSVADIVIHQGRSPLGTLTSAKMLRFYGNILADVERLELAGKFLKCLDRVSEQIPSPEHFSILQQSLMGLDRGLPNDLIATWFRFNVARSNGEEVNLLRDTSGMELDPEQKYYWNTAENALSPDFSGNIGAREIKFARFLLSNQLLMAAQVENYAQILPPVAKITQSFTELP